MSSPSAGFALKLVSAATFALAALVATLSNPVLAAEPGSPDAQRIEELEQRLQVLERKLEIQAEETSTKAKEAPVLVAGEKGFGLKSASGDYSLNFKLLTQADGRYYLGGSPQAAPVAVSTAATRDSFLFRRLEPTFDGNLGKLVGYRLTLRLDGDRNSSTSTPAGAVVQDVYVDLKFSPLASLRVGKWKEPLSLENIESAGALPFIERGYPTALTGNRDFGAAVFGSAFDSTVNYSLGVFNGAADGQDAPQSDTDGRKEVVARVFAEPFKNDYGPLRGLGLGVAGSVGSKRATTVTPSYSSAGQVAFFKYNSAVVSNGSQTRIVPQAYYYLNQFGVLAEYAQSRQELANGGNVRALGNEAYELTTNYVLTGEDASYAGVKPRSPYTLGGPGWGAFEVALRHGVLDIDDEAFAGASATRLADPNASAAKAKTYALGLNWYLSQNVKLASDFNFTSFDGGAAGGADRPDERALFTRAQLSF